MTIKASSKAAGGSGRPMYMPIHVLPEMSQIDIRDGASTSASNSTNFYTSVDTDHTLLGYEAATLSHTTGTEEQTIVDTGTGQQGVLTQVLLPVITAAGTQTIRVTIDGEVFTFTPEVSPTSTVNKVALGDFMPWASQTNTANSTGFGTKSNTGWGALSEQEYTMLTPKDSLMRGLPIGMVFKDSLKVTMQITGGAYAATSASNKALAAWLTSLPEGLI